MSEEIDIHEARTVKPRFNYRVESSEYARSIGITGTFGIDRLADARKEAHEWVDIMFHAIEAELEEQT